MEYSSKRHVVRLIVLSTLLWGSGASSVWAAGVSLTQSGGSTNVNETGPTSDSYTIVLDTQPTDTVEILVDPDIQTDLGAGAGSPILLTFTTSSWNTPQTVTVTAVDDAVVEGAHTSTITHTVTSVDPNYDGIVVPDVIANIIDNDSAGVIITQSGGSTDVSENGPTSDSYNIVLRSRPSSNVIITITPDAEVDLGAGPSAAITVSFTPGTWDFPRLIIVTAVDDAVPEGPHTSTILHSASSADANYDGIAISDVIVNVTDNDAPGVLLIQTGGSTNVSEQGATSDTYTIALVKAPTASVTIEVDPDEQTDLGDGPGVAISLVFTTLNWSVARQVTVTAADDAIPEGQHTSIITHTSTSSDPSYDGIAIADIVVNVADNDSVGVTITQSGGTTSVSETGPTSDSYTIVLDSQPASDVVITVSPDSQVDLGTGGGNPIDLTFTDVNWSTPQTVTVTAVDDAIYEGDHTSTITHTAASGDVNYDQLAIADVIVNVSDNEALGVSITQSGGSTNISENGPTSDSYTIELESQPTADVTITADPDEQADLGAGPGVAIQLTFTAGNWNTPQTVTVTAVDDAVAEGAHSSTIMHTAVSDDPAYDGIAIDSVVANITDNDTAGVIVTESGGSTDVAEAGSSDDYTVVLTSEPTQDVTITVDPDSQTDLGAGPGATITLTFTALDWSTPQTVTVTAVDDAVAEGAHSSTIVHSAASGDAAYDGMAIGSVVANITDNDTAGVIVTESGGSTDVAEGGSSDSYTIELESQPTANVTITVDPDGQTDLGAGPGVAITLTFTSGNWNTPQSVTVTAADDAVAEGAHSSTIVHSAASGDAAYDGMAIGSVVANITDNDTAGVIVTESGGSTDVAEGGSSDSYTIELESQPTANVTITVDPDGQTDLGAGPGVAIQLTFTAGNWNTPQTVTVTAVDDAVAEGPHSSIIVHTVGSVDSNYNGISVPNVVVGVTDNDRPGVTITEIGGSTNLSETGPTSDTYTIVLDSPPTATVSITATPDAQSSLGSGAGQPTIVVFEPINWNVPRTLVVTAIDDMLIEGPHTSTIVHNSVSADSNYDGIVIMDVVANITDNDTLGVLLTQSGGSTDVSEQGPTTDTYDLVLESLPDADVIITVDPDNQVDVGAGAGVAIDLTFTVGNWYMPQTVTVTAVDDSVAEGTHVSIIQHSVTSVDPIYQGAMVSNVTVNILDNDLAGVMIAQSSGYTRVSEGSTVADLYTIVLTSQPLGNVMIRVDPDSQTSVGAGPGNPIQLVFTPANWNTPQTVAVQAVDDAIVEGIHISTISHSSISTDPAYNGIEIANLAVEIVDNDVGQVQVGGSDGELLVYRETITILQRGFSPCGVAISGPLAITLLAMCVGKLGYRYGKRRLKTDY